MRYSHHATAIDTQFFYVLSRTLCHAFLFYQKLFYRRSSLRGADVCHVHVCTLKRYCHACLHLMLGTCHASDIFVAEVVVILVFMEFVSHLHHTQSLIRQRYACHALQPIVLWNLRVVTQCVTCHTLYFLQFSLR